MRHIKRSLCMILAVTRGCKALVSEISQDGPVRLVDPLIPGFIWNKLWGDCDQHRSLHLFLAYTSIIWLDYHNVIHVVWGNTSLRKKKHGSEINWLAYTCRYSLCLVHKWDSSVSDWSTNVFGFCTAAELWHSQCCVRMNAFLQLYSCQAIYIHMMASLCS